MTKEHIDLLTKDLCARLPYKVKLHAKYINVDLKELDGTLKQIDDDKICGFISDTEDTYSYIYVSIDEIKPYLFPLSSMTEEQENEWNDMHLNPLWEIVEDKFIGREKRLQLMFKSMIDPIQWCYKNNFDCNGLIPLGLAEDATNKNIY